MYNYKITSSFYNIINSIEDFRHFSVNTAKEVCILS